MKTLRYWLIGLSGLAIAQVVLVATNFAQEDRPEGDSKDFIYTADARNPFTPLFVPTPKPTSPPTATPTPLISTPTPTPTGVPFPRLRLEGVFWDSEEPLAIINHQLLRTGEYVSGARIVEIDRDRIFLNFHGYPMELGRLEEDYTVYID